MNNDKKHQLLDNLLLLKHKLTWAAQTKNENIHEYNSRITRLLEAYNNAGKLSQIHFTEVIENSWQREKLAIHTYIRGLKPEIKRYICQEYIYQNLYQAQKHAEQIQFNLIDIKKLKRTSFIESFAD